MKELWIAIRSVIVMTCLLGVIYPAVVTIVGQLFWSDKAQGSLVQRDGRVIGSELLAQKFESPTYFWPRPSAGDFQTVPSGASNSGPTSSDLLAAVEKRRKALAKNFDEIPPSMLFASGSGLDPDISPQAAKAQVRRVATARKLSNSQTDELTKLVIGTINVRQLWILGEPVVNVLKLNLALDEKFGKPSQK